MVYSLHAKFALHDLKMSILNVRDSEREEEKTLWNSLALLQASGAWHPFVWDIDTDHENYILQLHTRNHRQALEVTFCRVNGALVPAWQRRVNDGPWEREVPDGFPGWDPEHPETTFGWSNARRTFLGVPVLRHFGGDEADDTAPLRSPPVV